MMNLYNRLQLRAVTSNLQNFLHIRLENWLTPIKFEELRRSSNLRANAITKDWLEKLSIMFDMAGKVNAEPYKRTRVCKNVCLYSSLFDDVEKNKKTQILCFSGKSERMMMPLPVFLQHFDAKSTDIFFVRYPRGHCYAKGIPGIANDFESTLNVIGNLIHTDDYEKKVAIGTSAGALPALLAALKFSYDAVMSVGTGAPSDERWEKKAGADTFASNFLKDHAKKMHPTAIYLVLGADDADDARSANEIASLISIEKLVISSSHQRVDHLCLPPLVYTGKFNGLLNRTILKP